MIQKLRCIIVLKPHLKTRSRKISRMARLRVGQQRLTQMVPTTLMGTAAECIDEIVSFVQEFGITDIASSGLPPGVPPEMMATNLERLATEVLPQVRDAIDR